MPHFDIIRQVAPKETFRVASLMGTYDLQTNKVTEHFEGDINLPEKWNVGIIVGRSGTGKTTIAKELFGQYIKTFEYSAECVLDDFPKNATMHEIETALTSVGFASAPSWLKPYAVLSNGEKMRCDIARCMCEKDEIIVFDEFTSVVDRNVAKVASFAIQKAIRRKDMKFIAVSCHEDIVEHLMPDWIFNTDTMTFSLFDVETQKKNRERFVVDIYEITPPNEKREMWKVFAKYHYLSANFNHSAKTFVGYVNGKLAAFCGVCHFCHPRMDAWREHRSVVLPDYQGVGIGTAFTDAVAQLFINNGKRFISTTSNPAMIFSRKKSAKWKCTDYGRKILNSKTHEYYNKRQNSSSNRITASFEFIAKPTKQCPTTHGAMS